MNSPSNYPKISIVTPSFNQGKYIEQTIKSVLGQNYANVEYIVVDGGSSDNTLNVLKKYNNKIKWTSRKDNGQSNAINKGLKMATGEIIAFLNSDDLYLPGTLNKISAFFKNNPKAKWVTGDYFIINENGEKIQSYVVLYKKILRLFPYSFILSIANFIPQPSTFWRKELLDEVGFFNETLHFTMDYDYWLKIIKKYPLKVISSPLSAFRIYRESKGGGRFKEQFKEEIKVLKKNTRNIFLIFLHRIHNILILKIYNKIK
ncbi:MAG: glycosyltransferase family 2 protein [Candidatus Levybacteria bacterium]|nr:glycosyltransferase family 2 protein [Candidatus Levybacteria bacterium]